MRLTSTPRTEGSLEREVLSCTAPGPQTPLCLRHCAACTRPQPRWAPASPALERARQRPLGAESTRRCPGDAHGLSPHGDACSLSLHLLFPGSCHVAPLRYRDALPSTAPGRKEPKLPWVVVVGGGSSHLPPLGSRELISEFFVKHFEAHKAGSSERRHCKGFVYRRCRGRGEPDACSPALPAPSPSRLLSCLTSVPLAPGSLGQETPEGTGS